MDDRTQMGTTFLSYILKLLKQLSSMWRIISYHGHLYGSL